MVKGVLKNYLKSMFYTDKAIGLLYQFGLQRVVVEGNYLLCEFSSPNAKVAASYLMLHGVEHQVLTSKYMSIEKDSLTELSNKFLGLGKNDYSYNSTPRIGHPKVPIDEGLRHVFKGLRGAVNVS